MAITFPISFALLARSLSYACQCHKNFSNSRPHARYYRLIAFDQYIQLDLIRVQVFNTVIGKMVTAVLWTSPIGVASLIAASICRACDLANTLAALGLWVLTVLLGLGLQGCLVLPLVLWGTTRTSPWAIIKGFSQSLVLAFGTGSGAAALPVSHRMPVSDAVLCCAMLCSCNST